jgi:type I restriction enzyme S subunit
MINKISQPANSSYPILRFHEFAEKWQSKELGDIAVFLKGKGIAKQDISEDGKYKCIRYGELYTDYREIISIVKSRTNINPEDSFSSQANDLLIPSSGETAIDIATVSCVPEDNILLSGDLNIIRLQKDNCGNFFSQYLTNFCKTKIAKLAQGNAVVHLYASQLKKLKINTPSAQEQRNIGEFLSSIDSWVGNLRSQSEALSSYKKSITQKIFSQEIRFKGENGEVYPEWKEMALGDILDYEQPTKYIVQSTEYNDKFRIPVLTAGKTFILGYTDETDGICKDNLPVIIFDDFTTTSQYVDFPFKVKSSAMKILRSKNNQSIKLLYELIQTIKYQIGGHGRHWISKYSKIRIQIPSLGEQIKIANFLTSIDKSIESKQNQIKNAEIWKKGLIQRMFV